MAKRIYLGATRRQRSRAMQNLGITVSILVVFFLLCAFFAAWLMANEGKLTLDPPQDTQAPQDEPIQTERTEPPVTSYLPDTEPVSQMPELPLTDVLISGIPTKMLDYTDTWVVMLDAGHGFDAVIDGKTPLIKEKSDDEAYYVIKYVTAPSVLCEIGFVTNAEDASSMLDPAWRERAAKGLCDGISYYIATADTLRHS